MSVTRTLTLDERVVNRLDGFTGDRTEDKVLYLLREVALARLRECSEHIAGFEFRYGMSFGQFDAAWEQGQVSDKHSYPVETDYMKWEALEMEKRHWLAVARDLPPALV